MNLALSVAAFTNNKSVEEEEEGETEDVPREKVNRAFLII